MRHIVVAVVTLTLFATSTGLAYAQGSTTSVTTRKDQAKERTVQLRENALERAQQLQESYASKAAERRATIEDKLADHREQMASRAAQLRQRLDEFKDKRKAALVERINNVLNRINEKRTEVMRKHLERMSELLDKLVYRVASKGAEGKDTTQADGAIASASAAIASASAAVDAQALKDYTIEVSSESGVRADAKVARDALHADLRAVRQLVITAKQAIAAAIRTAATTLGGIGEGQ